MINAAVGFRVHSGWSALVAVALEGRQPVVLCRKRVQLVETFNYDFRQPYHTAKKVSLEGGREFIATGARKRQNSLPAPCARCKRR